MPDTQAVPSTSQNSNSSSNQRNAESTKRSSNFRKNKRNRRRGKNRKGPQGAKSVKPQQPSKSYISSCCNAPGRKPRCGSKTTVSDPETKKAKEVALGLGHWHCSECNKSCKVKVEALSAAVPDAPPPVAEGGQ